MKQTFRTRVLGWFGVLCSIFTFVSMGVNTDDDLYATFEGTWVFEKAEYLEWDAAGKSYQLKRVIANEEDLYALEACYFDLIKEAEIRGDVAIVQNLHGILCGRYFIGTLDDGIKKKHLITIGNPEEVGLHDDRIGMTYNAHGNRYYIEKTDPDRICFTLEQICYENGKEKEGMVVCYLKSL